jgi:hypothetical protein
MLVRVSVGATVQASNQTVTTVYTDPVSLGEYNLAAGVLVVYQIQVPATNTGGMKIFAEFSNDGANWVGDGTELLDALSTNGAQQVLMVSGVNAEFAYMRFKYVVDPALTGTDDGVAFFTFDWVIRLSNQ